MKSPQIGAESRNGGVLKAFSTQHFNRVCAARKERAHKPKELLLLAAESLCANE